MNHILVFTIGESRHALPLSVIDRVIRTVEVTRLSETPGLIRGVINLQGKVIPVIDLRHRLGLPWREQMPEDRLIIAHTSRRMVAVMADSVNGVPQLSSRDLFTANADLAWAEDVIGMTKLDEDLIPIYSLDRLLSLNGETPRPEDGEEAT